VTLHILQYSYSIMTGLATMCCCIDYINFTAVDGLEEVHRRNGCSYTVSTEMELQWHCLLCSTAIDCCSTFRHTLLDTERSVTSHTVRIEEPIIGHSCLCLHNVSPNFNKIST